MVMNDFTLSQRQLFDKLKSAAKTIEEKLIRKLAVLKRSVDDKAFTKSELFESL